jgi:hypothetical protein
LSLCGLERERKRERDMMVKHGAQACSGFRTDCSNGWC